MIYLYDGSFPGFLCCLFNSFERRHFDIRLSTREHFQEDIFSQKIAIPTESDKAERVKQGLIKRVGSAAFHDFYKVYLSENPNAIQAIFVIAVRVFKENIDFLKNHADPFIHTFHSTLRQVNRERHRMKAFVRFKEDMQGYYFATIEPDFNVLPLIIRFFKKRYADQPWIIYDIRRNYGASYNLQSITEVRLQAVEATERLPANQEIPLSQHENYYEQLWKSYFHSTNIVERRNMKLHLRHVPKRYWKYLPEKQTD